MTKTTRWCMILTIAILTMSLTACTPPVTSQPDSSQSDPESVSPTPYIADVNISVERDTAPDVAGDDLSQLVNGNSAFAFDLYQALRESGEDNLIFSPYSVSLALAMTHAGACTTTEQAIADTMYYLLPQDQLHPAFNALDLDLPTKDEQAEPDQLVEGERFQLNIANAIWGQKGIPFREEFLVTLGTNYSAGLQTLDFAQQPEESRQVINQWVEDQTEGAIQNIAPPEAITPETRLVITNAIYFNATWLHTFEESDTLNEPFTLLDGSQVSVPMMNQEKILDYMQGEGYQAVALQYYGNDVEMIAILPDEGRFEEIEQGLSLDFFNEIIQTKSYTNVILSMPRFEFESTLPLTGILTDMGMGEAFTTGADFSGMADKELYIDEVLQKALIQANEIGTEISAATMLVQIQGAEPELVNPPEPVRLRLDRPFIIAVREWHTGTILFLGRVMNPVS